MRSSASPLPTVMHLHLHRRRTGVTRHLEDVVRGLSARGAAAVGIGLRIPRGSAAELWRRARAGGGLVLHAHRNLELLAALVLRALGRSVRVVFTRHGTGRPSAWTRMLAKRADARIVLTAGAARDFGLPARIVPHGVDLTRHRPSPDRRGAWAALGFGGSFGVGVVGRLRPAKGQADFAAAVSPLLVERREWRALLLGSARPADAAWARALVRTAGPGLIQVPERENVTAVYAGLTILVQPSHAESFSLVLLEALASGCCVVAARLPHYEDYLEDGRTGFFFPPGDVLALRTLLVRLMADPDAAEAVGRAGRAFVQERHGLAHELDALGALYEGCLAAGVR